jgi:hypothetical protein
MEKSDWYLRVLLLIGAWFAVIAIFAVWEYDTLKAEMVLNEKLLAIDRIAQQAPLSGGAPMYVLALITWTILILVLGLVWSEVLFPHRNLLEKIIFSLVFGVFVMPLSIFIPFMVITAATVLGTLFGTGTPAFVEPILVGGLVDLFVSGLEQVYEFANVFAFLVVGLVLLMVKKMMAKGRQGFPEALA